ncbi:sulfotransferase [Ruegeria lacuscaerulensis]|uniref:sulfotransferase n=1 Tax=Ruegeria lacuscaerulensis TaxID=55218 RepID=UPI00147C9FE2|nr:sulfotransferase [Ruegeria lacuscaerulensis]
MGQEPLVSYSSWRAKYLNLFVSGLLSPLEFILEYRTRSDDHPVCFIVGPPRSGSTLLYELMVTRFQCGYFANLAKRLFRVPVAATWLCRKAMRDRQGSFDSVYGELEGKAAPSEAGRIWAHWMPYAAPYLLDKPGLTPARMRRKLAAISRIAGRPMIVKNMILQSDFPLLLKTFPNAVFIYIERDWADNAHSLVRARQDKTSMDASGWWSLRPTGWEAYSDADPITQSCAQVILSHRDLQVGFRTLENSDRVMKISYETLCAEPERALSDMEAFFARNGLDVLRKSAPKALPEITTRRQPEDETRSQIMASLDKIEAEAAS